jgi:hypothetical protein
MMVFVERKKSFWGFSAKSANEPMFSNAVMQA